MIEPTKIVEESGTEVSITWSDESETRYKAPALRRACPCAACVNEWTGEKILRDDKVPDDLTFSHITMVGRYALNFHFSDGHNTGIYSFQFLRKMAQEG